MRLRFRQSLLAALLSVGLECQAGLGKIIAKAKRLLLEREELAVANTRENPSLNHRPPGVRS
jgi:hypothetical protein